MKWYHTIATDTYTSFDSNARIVSAGDVFAIRVRNRNGGYNVAYASSLAAAKRKARRMIREEAK